MHRIRVIGRPVALLALTAVLLAVVAWFSGGATQGDRAFADDVFDNSPYISCADTYVDLPPANVKGQPPGAGDVIPSGSSITRGEPSQAFPGDPTAVDQTVITYIGVIPPGGTIPVAGAGPLCADVTTAAKAGPENNRLDNRINYAMVSSDRPTTTAHLVTKGAELNLDYYTCVLQATNGQWMRTEVSVVEAEKGPNGTNYGLGTLYTDAGHSSTDPQGCGTAGVHLYDWLAAGMTGPAPTIFPFVIVTTGRQPATDLPGLPKNAGILVDPDGSAKVKGTPQGPDGDTVADDWDGDGCPDWDELDKDRYSGLDPFNPHDCNQSVDASGIYRIRAAPVAAGKDGTGNPTPGIYFHCIGDMQQVVNDLDMRLYCYTDTNFSAVNPQAGPQVGDGYENSPPPAEAVPQEGGSAESGAQCQNAIDEDADTVADDGCPAIFGDVDDVQAVLTGTYNPGANTITLSGCYEDRDGHSSVGNVYLESTQNAHTGEGTADIWVLQTTANCVAGTPVGTASFPAAPITSVKLSEKGPCAKSEPQCAAGGQHDFDGDNCPDKNELSNNQQQGGLRDPYNRWDYFNPTLDGQNRVDDILAVVNQYFIDEGNPEYTKNADRTAVIGANPWNLGPPNGQQRVDDILAAVKSYFHDCDGGDFNDPDGE